MAAARKLWPGGTAAAADDDRFVTGGSRSRAGTRERRDERDVAAEGVGTRLTYLADNVNLLMPELFHGHAHLRLLEVAFGEPAAKLRLDLTLGLSRRLDATDQRKGDVAVSVDGESALTSPADSRP